MIVWSVKDTNLMAQLSDVSLSIQVSESVVNDPSLHSHLMFGDGLDILFGDSTEVVYA